MPAWAGPERDAPMVATQQTARRPHVFLLGCGGCDLCTMRIASAMPFVLGGILAAAALVRVFL